MLLTHATGIYITHHAPPMWPHITLPPFPLLPPPPPHSPFLYPLTNPPHPTPHSPLPTPHSPLLYPLTNPPTQCQNSLKPPTSSPPPALVATFPPSQPPLAASVHGFTLTLLTLTSSCTAVGSTLWLDLSVTHTVPQPSSIAATSPYAMWPSSHPPATTLPPAIPRGS